MNRLKRPPTTALVLVLVVALAAGLTAGGFALGDQRDREARHHHELTGRLAAVEARLDALVTLAQHSEDVSDAARAELVDLRAELDRILRGVRATSAGRAVIASPSAPQPAAAPTPERWLALAACESTGDDDGKAPHVIDVGATSKTTPTYYGPLQESRSTNLAAGGDGDPRDDPLDVTLARGQAWAARPDIDGRGQWPTCWPKVMGDEPR